MQRVDRLRLSYWRVWQMTEIANFGGDRDSEVAERMNGTRKGYCKSRTAFMYRL